MAVTARFVQGIPDKAVVFTGSLQPAGFRFTDAVFNVAFALGVLQASSGGVFVAMNGQAFLPEGVRKNRAANRFEAI